MSDDLREQIFAKHLEAAMVDGLDVKKKYVSFLWETWYALQGIGLPTSLFAVIEKQIESEEDFMKDYAHLYENHPGDDKNV